MEGFAEGYSFFEKNSGSYTSATMGNAYVQDVTDAINIYYNNSDYLQKARKYGHFTGYKN